MQSEFRPSFPKQEPNSSCQFAIENSLVKIKSTWESPSHSNKADVGNRVDGPFRIISEPWTINHQFLFQLATVAAADYGEDADDEDGAEERVKGMKMLVLKLQRPQNSCMHRNRNC